MVSGDLGLRAINKGIVSFANASLVPRYALRLRYALVVCRAYGPHAKDTLAGGTDPQFRGR